MESADGGQLRVSSLRKTKDSTEGENALGGKTWISWIPWDLYEEVQQYCDDEGIEGDDEIFSVTADWLGKQIKRAAEATAVATGDSDYNYIRSHDLRAYYATNMVRRLGVGIEVVTEMGSWDSRKAIEPYLASPLPRDLQDELARAGVTQKDVPAPPRQDEFGKILIRLEQIERALDLRDVVDVTSLTKNDVQALKDQLEDEEQEAEEADFESTTLLNDFLKAATPSTAVALGMMVTHTAGCCFRGLGPAPSRPSLIPSKYRPQRGSRWSSVVGANGPVCAHCRRRVGGVLRCLFEQVEITGRTHIDALGKDSRVREQAVAVDGINRGRWARREGSRAFEVGETVSAWVG